MQMQKKIGTKSHCL